MKLLLTCVLLSGCTTIYYPSGKKLACVGSDIDQLDIVARGITVHAVNVRNSVIVKEHGNNIVKGGTAAATSGLFGFLGSILK